ncbi:MAG: class I SAM-dependent methyltransferase [Solirubrobacterales bacterium]|nr:class I SAM-dependent methyltransferase [Solirubrobacterales bacterium]
MADRGDEPFVAYAGTDAAVNWSEELETVHAEASRTHFLDRWTRRAIIDGIGPLAPGATVADLGCSTGFLLEDLHTAHPDAALIGVDMIAAGLRKAHGAVPEARLLQADVCDLPLEDESLDAVVSANLLEHVPDDRRALREIARALKPGGSAALVVPAGPRTFDYYDRFLGHERRYARGELSEKCRAAGLEPREDRHLGSLLYPAFWLVKQRNRRRYDHLRGEALAGRVTQDIARTRDSRLGEFTWHVEDRLVHAGMRLPFGIRSFVVAWRVS